MKHLRTRWSDVTFDNALIMAYKLFSDIKILIKSFGLQNESQ